MAASASADNLPIKLVRRIFRRIFAELLGKSSLEIVELRLRRALGEDPYVVLCRDPAGFSLELRKIMGDSDNLLKIAADKLAGKYSRCNGLTSLREGDEAFFDLLFEAAREAAERIAPGAVCLMPHEAEAALKLLKLLKDAGGIDEQVHGDFGWAAKIKSVIILGIRHRDKMIPVALYSRRYARIDAIARRWLEEAPLILKAAISDLEASK